MGQTFASLFSMIGSFLRAGAKVGNSLENLATVGVEASAALVDEARADRELKLITSAARREELQKRLIANKVAATKAEKAKAKKAKAATAAATAE